MGFEGPKPSTAFRFSHSAFPKMHAPAAPNPAPPHRLVIKAGEAEKNYWRDLWRYRELFQVLAWRDVAVRYKQTVHRCRVGL